MSTTTRLRDPDTGRFMPRSTTMPEVVVAGGLVWHAAEECTDTGAQIGYELAVRLGVHSRATAADG